MYKQLLKKMEIESSLFRRDENTDVNVVFRNTIEIIMLQGDARKVMGNIGSKKTQHSLFRRHSFFPVPGKRKISGPFIYIINFKMIMRMESVVYIRYMNINCDILFLIL